MTTTILPRYLSQPPGRAGRDGGLSLCHTFLNDNDFINYHSLSHSTGVSDGQVRGLLQLLVDQDPRNLPADIAGGDGDGDDGGGGGGDGGGASDRSSSGGHGNAGHEASAGIPDDHVSRTAGGRASTSAFRAYEAVVPIERCQLELDMQQAVIETIITFLSQVCGDD